MPAPRLSLCMIVKDEASHLARCLESVSPLHPQIVVVDTGSSDGTVAIAQHWGAEVYSFAWIHDFSAARNASLQRARAAWTLVLDADEWLEPPAREALAEICSTPPDAAYVLVQKSRDSGGGFIRNGIVRLFPNRPEIRYAHPIHEDVMGSLSRQKIPVRYTEVEIEHSGYADATTLSAKLDRNRRILERALQGPIERGSESHARFNLGIEYMREGNASEALSQFEWCIQHAPPGSRTHALCTLKSAECLCALDRAAEAKTRLPSKPDRTEHPTALMLMARIEHQRDAASAVPWLETLLHVPDVTHAFPVNLAQVKLAAVTQLGRLALEQGRVKTAIALISLGKEMKEGRIDGASEEIALRYRTAVDSAG
jgi:hypothetical protein